MYTVKQVSSLTGVTEATLRAWERRYGVVQPTRSPGGYRLYDDAQLALLREMASLVHEGVPASRAAEALNGRLEPTSEDGRTPMPDNEELVEAAAALDPVQLRRVIDEAFASGPFETIAETWIPAQIKRVGDAWEAGRLTVAQEHFASAGLMRAIAGVFSDAPEPNPAQPVLVGLPPGARHDLMLFCFAACLRRLGSAVVYLGTDVPVASWLQAATDSRPRAAVMAVTARQEVSHAQAIVDHLAEVVPPVTVWTGGSLREEVRGANPLPDAVGQAAAILHRSLVAGRT